MTTGLATCMWHGLMFHDSSFVFLRFAHKFLKRINSFPQLGMPRGGKRKGAGVPVGYSNALGNKGGTAQPGNSNALGNKGNKGAAGAAPGNSYSLGNKGGAALGNTSSSSPANKASKLFAQGLELERHSDIIKAIIAYRAVIQLEPEHADAHSCLARLLSIEFLRGHRVISGRY